jgi:hypothetical protein
MSAAITVADRTTPSQLPRPIVSAVAALAGVGLAGAVLAIVTVAWETGVGGTDVRAVRFAAVPTGVAAHSAGLAAAPDFRDGPLVEVTRLVDVQPLSVPHVNVGEDGDDALVVADGVDVVVLLSTPPGTPEGLPGQARAGRKGV